ncbi:MAG: hypothetical protein SFW64_04300 [Alphaproteobacteria bacterium]|nr:hypothetical protein [Alphaproteobacteria bacterium]
MDRAAPSENGIAHVPLASGGQCEVQRRDGVVYTDFASAAASLFNANHTGLAHGRPDAATDMPEVKYSHRNDGGKIVTGILTAGVSRVSRWNDLRQWLGRQFGGEAPEDSYAAVGIATKTLRALGVVCTDAHGAPTVPATAREIQAIGNAATESRTPRTP